MIVYWISYTVWVIATLAALDARMPVWWWPIAIFFAGAAVAKIAALSPSTSDRERRPLDAVRGLLGLLWFGIFLWAGFADLWHLLIVVRLLQALTVSCYALAVAREL